jgi:hypothetical protein
VVVDAVEILKRNIQHFLTEQEERRYGARLDIKNGKLKITKKGEGLAKRVHV